MLAHSVSWGCFNNDSKGKIIQDLVLQQNLSLMNNGSMTYLSPASGVCLLYTSDAADE